MFHTSSCQGEGGAGRQRGQQEGYSTNIDAIMNDEEDLFIPRLTPEEHAMPYQPPPLDLNDQTGMGFGGADTTSDESSSPQPIGGIQFDWEQWNMMENFSYSVNDHVILPGIPQEDFNADSNEGLNPNDNWYPFPAKEVCS
jgi:hypothetical protein